MVNNDQDHGGMEADMETPLQQGQPPEFFLRRRHYVPDGQKTNKITGMSTSSEMTDSDEEHGAGMEAGIERLCRRRTVAGRKMTIITVNDATGNYLELEVDLSSDTIRDVMVSVKEEWGVPLYKQRIILNGEVLQTDCTLAHCGIKESSTVYMIQRLRGGGEPEASKKRWCTYSTKALQITVALFYAYLNNNSTSTSPNIVRVIPFLTAVLLFVIIDAALALQRLPDHYSNSLVGFSWFLQELISCLLSISFNTYYAIAFPALLVLVVAAALIFGDDVDYTGDDRDTINRDFDRLFKLSECITTCGGLITVVLGHYDTVVGPGKEVVGFFFFLTIALGLYLMMVITVRAVSRHHATWLASALMVLLAITIIIASICFICSPLRRHRKVLEIQQQNNTLTFGDPARAQHS